MATQSSWNQPAPEYSDECFEFHGGNQITIAKEFLRAGEIALPISDVFEGID